MGAGAGRGIVLGMLATLALFALAVMVAVPSPQDAPQVPAGTRMQDDAEALAEALDAAHRGPKAPAKVESFRAEVRLEPRQKDEEAVTVDLEVEFQAPKSLRATAREKGVSVEEGYDPQRGAWVRKDGEVTALQGPSHNQAADKVLNEVRLCRQVLGFLDPKSLIARMETPSAVRREDLELTTRLRYPGCRVVEGTIDSFPTYTLGTEGRARVTVYVHGETGRLVAVSALPLGADDKPQQLAELVLLGEYAPVQDVQLPAKLNVYRLAGPGKELLMTVRIQSIELGSTFKKDHFKRPG